MKGFFCIADFVNGRRVRLVNLPVDMMLFYTIEVDKGKGHKRSPHSELANLKCFIRGQDVEDLNLDPLGEQGL